MQVTAEWRASTGRRWRSSAEWRASQSEEMARRRRSGDGFAKWRNHHLLLRWSSSLTSHAGETTTYCSDLLLFPGGPRPSLPPPSICSAAGSPAG
nr:hypothetical protein Itr_chr01CG05890 [Ipomoea trifida]